jgi:protocatechuate 3,4-dioxygenase beta subunit
MRVNRTSIRRAAQALHARELRRKLLKGLGAFAMSAPALAVFGCTSDNKKDDDVSAITGTGGASPTDMSMTGTGGTPSGSGGTSSTGAGMAQNGSGGTPAMTGTGGGTPNGMAGNTAPNMNDAGGMATNTMDAGHDAGVADDTPPMFDDAASCMLTTTDIEGPFFIDEGEIPDDESMVRRDVREGMAGCEFRMYFRLLDAKKQCAPIAGAEMYIWHCNADGYYSGFNGQDPTMPYSGSPNPAPMNMDRFCRGIQTTDDDGVASFVTMYPGWYAGRPIHVHLVARVPGQTTTRYITTQLYFPAAFTTEVHESEPAYMARASMIPDGSRNPPAGNPAMMTLTHTPGLVVGTLNVIVNG